MEPVARGESWEACVETGITGLVGTISLMVVDNVGGIWFAASTADIVETPAGSGVYCATRPGIIVTGHYGLVWSTDGTYDEKSTALDDLFIVSAPGSGPLPPLPPPGGGGDYVGPCSAWTTADDVLLCCGVDDTLDSMPFDTSVFEIPVTVASEFFFELSGRRFGGTCEQTVIACESDCDCHRHKHWHRWTERCSCPPRVKLSGYPVRAIGQVTLNGVLLDPSEYELERAKYVNLRNGSRWPDCERLCREGTEAENTITYTFGQDPPLMGQLAAQALACEIYNACNDRECKLPTGAVRIVRQGVTVDRLQPLASMLRQGDTGILAIDEFVEAYCRVRRQPIFYSPDGKKFARKLPV